MNEVSKSHSTTTIQIGKKIPLWADDKTGKFEIGVPEIAGRLQVNVSEILLGRRLSPHSKLSNLDNLTNTENIALKYPNGDEIPLTTNMKDKICGYLKMHSKVNTLGTTFENGEFDGYFDCGNFANYLIGNSYHNRFLDLNNFHIFSGIESNEIGDMIFMTSGTFEFKGIDGTKEINISSAHFSGMHYAIYVGRGLYIQKLGDGKGFEVLDLKNMQKLYQSLPLIFTLKKGK